jgi:hypothetical protein
MKVLVTVNSSHLITENCAISDYSCKCLCPIKFAGPT